MRRIVLTTLAAVGLSACGHVDAYEEAVYDMEPTYCYQSIGEVVCFREPYHRDSERLVNYYGPHPSRYDAPPAPPAPTLIAPAAAGTWVKDPEPAVFPSPAAVARAEQGRPVARPMVPRLDVPEPAWLFDTIEAPDPVPATPARPQALSLETAPEALPAEPVEPSPLAPADGDVAPL